MIEPWSITVNNIEYIFHVLTCIDPFTNLVKLIRINNKISRHVSEQFGNCWLSQYPSPNRCVHNGGGEFIGHDSQQMLIKHTITNGQSTTRNPQSNLIYERMHQTVANVTQIIMRTSNLTVFKQAAQVVDNALATCMHVTQFAVHDALQTSLGALVYGRDMFVDVPVITDLIAIRNRRQLLVNHNLMQHNRKRYDYHYRVGDEVMITTYNYDPTKLQEQLHRPYRIVETRTKGTICVQTQEPNIDDTFNTRKLRHSKGPLKTLRDILAQC